MTLDANHPLSHRHQSQSPSPLGGGVKTIWSKGLCRDHHQKSGFTLIELMITVAIVAILAAIAYPSYIQYVKRAHRADAKTALLGNAQFLERNFTESNAYDKTPPPVANITAASLPYKTSPSSGAAIYTIGLTVDATTYTLTATPAAGGAMDGDICGAMTLDHLGVKGAGGGAVAQCWGR